MRPLLLSLLLTAACHSAANDKPATSPSDEGAVALHAECCTQCAGAAKRDPAGADLSGKDCTAYAGDWNGQPGVDVKCVAHFGQKPTTVGECWKEQPQLK